MWAMLGMSGPMFESLSMAGKESVFLYTFLCIKDCAELLKREEILCQRNFQSKSLIFKRN